MTYQQLFKVSEAATLIAEVTGGDKFDIAKRISHETRLTNFQFYDSEGRAFRCAQVPYGITSDLQEWQTLRAIGHPDAKDRPKNEALRFSTNPSFFHRMDINQLLNFLGYHPSIQERILNARPLIESEPTLALTDSASNSTTPDPERRLARLRALGGNAIYRRSEWRFNGIGALEASEQSEGRPRSSQKTIRADLIEAAENEREAKRENAFAGLGQR